jgi:hypothetical protein
MTLVEEIYSVTKSFPRYEQFGLTSARKVANRCGYRPTAISHRLPATSY